MLQFLFFYMYIYIKQKKKKKKTWKKLSWTEHSWDGKKTFDLESSNVAKVDSDK